MVDILCITFVLIEKETAVKMIFQKTAIFVIMSWFILLSNLPKNPPIVQSFFNSISPSEDYVTAKNSTFLPVIFLQILKT